MIIEALPVKLCTATKALKSAIGMRELIRNAVGFVRYFSGTK
jgi:hypothetical protein